MAIDIKKLKKIETDEDTFIVISEESLMWLLQSMSVTLADDLRAVEGLPSLHEKIKQNLDSVRKAIKVLEEEEVPLLTKL